VLAIGIVGSIVTLALNQVLIRRGATPRRRLLVGGGMIVVCTALVLIAMPPTVDMVGTPADLIMRFRAFSLGGLALFWLVLGSGFALFVRRAQAAASLAPPRSSVSVSRS
jgi:predicted cobalt transporter CbtA